MSSLANFFDDVKVLLAAATTKSPSANEINSVGLLIENNASKFTSAIALICEEESVTWKVLNERANRIANFLKGEGIKQGDVISLFMQNRIEFVVMVVAIGKLGAIAGLINTNLTRQQLVHCIGLTNSKKCIFGEELSESINDARDELNLNDGEDYLFVRDLGTAPAPSWSKEIVSSDESLDPSNPEETKTIPISSTGFFIFTSGTTGLPKAARVSYKRILPVANMTSRWVLRINQTDRLYNCLPLYHGTGLLIGTLSAFSVGASVVLRRRLSVSAFWNDIKKYECTCFVYIGEFIRYLVSHPVSPEDAHNKIRAIVGNGLRPDIWHEFKNRFAIERIGEFYAASEGNGGFANVLNKDCTVGLGTAPSVIVAYDVANDAIVKTDDGFCVPQADGEPGLLLIEITKKSEFDGYTSVEATNKKIVNNVLLQGDAYFNTGDLMKTIDVGFAFWQKHYQFVDRVGDTYRWKSENVSTNEVGEIINQHEDIVFTNAYGVEIPGTDGRAGMAAIVINTTTKPQGLGLDLAGLSNHIIDNLPSYARPIFLRVLKELPTTSTHKLQKNDLRDQAFHLDQVTDELLVLRPGESTYTKLDSDYYDQIMRREVAF